MPPVIGAEVRIRVSGGLTTFLAGDLYPLKRRVADFREVVDAARPTPRLHRDACRRLERDSPPVVPRLPGEPVAVRGDVNGGALALPVEPTQGVQEGLAATEAEGELGREMVDGRGRSAALLIEQALEARLPATLEIEGRIDRAPHLLPEVEDELLGEPGGRKPQAPDERLCLWAKDSGPTFAQCKLRAELPPIRRIEPGRPSGEAHSYAGIGQQDLEEPHMGRELGQVPP